MCGIAGFIDYRLEKNEQVLRDITDALIHRGPDDAGYFYKKNQKYSVGLGHRRLSILDLSPNGHQPMHFKHLSIVYNGEVYNFREIRDELVELGHTFQSESDTEVILIGFQVWGANVLEKLIGMFAFAIYDNEKHMISLFRDRAGVKPLYYSFNDEGLTFASELKAFTKYPGFNKAINQEALVQYMSLGYIPAPLSIFESVKKLRPGHTLNLDIQRNLISEHCYWNIVDYYNKPLLNLTYEEATIELEKLFLSAFRYRLISDVDYGIFFSGGYDSTAVAAILQANLDFKLRTFSIGFNQSEVDESKHARKVADYIGTDHTEFICTEKEAIETVEQLPLIFDEPISDNSCIPTYLLSRVTRQHVTVALSGDGGDELFGGYDKYYTNLSWYSKLYKGSPLIRKFGYSVLKGLKRLKAQRWIFNGEARMENMQMLFSSNQNKAIATKIQAKLFTGDELRRLMCQKSDVCFSGTSFDEFSEIKNNQSLLNKLFAIDYKTFMVDDILVKVDRAGMAVSLEGREPLLDHRIAEFVAQLPAEFKFRNGQRKAILKDIVHKYVPKEMMDRPKQGFVIPLQHWLKNDLFYLIEKFLSKDKIEQSGIFNFSEITIIRDRFLQGSVSDGDRLWRILILQMWYFKYMTNEA